MTNSLQEAPKGSKRPQTAPGVCGLGRIGPFQTELVGLSGFGRFGSNWAAWGRIARFGPNWSFVVSWNRIGPNWTVWGRLVLFGPNCVFGDRFGPFGTELGRNGRFGVELEPAVRPAGRFPPKEFQESQESRTNLKPRTYIFIKIYGDV